MLGALIATSISLSPVVVADLAPTNASSAVPAAQTPDPAQVAQKEFIALAHGSIDRSHYTQKMATSLTDANISTAAKYLATLGDLKRLGLNSTHRINGESVYEYIMVCADGNTPMTLSLNQAGLVDGIFFGSWQSWQCTATAGCPGWPGNLLDFGIPERSGQGDPWGPNDPNQNGGYNPPAISQTH
jgi:hypothetical protein